MGLITLALVEGLVVSPGLYNALAALALCLCLGAPSPVRRYVWHTFANHVGVEPPMTIASARVIDGDTIEDCATGIRYRLANIDAPETGDNAKCFHERQRGEIARNVAVGLIDAAETVQVRRTYRTDQFGRRVAFVLVDGKDLGLFLVGCGLARPWRGQRRRWCGTDGGLARIARAGLMAHRCGTCRNWRNDG
ncbi:MAG: thermonuclease family protein [Hyphomonadaceae bacterium]